MRRNLVFSMTILIASLSGCKSAPKPAAGDTAPQSQQLQTPAPTSLSSSPAGAPETGAVSQPGTPATLPEQAAAVVPEPPAPIVIPVGTRISVSLHQSLGSKTSKTGDSFSGAVAKSVRLGGETVVPISSPAVGSVVEAKAKGKVKGEGVLSLTLTQITIKGTPYKIASNISVQTVKGKGKRTGVATGGGAAGGALIGGIAGGGKGAAIGAGVGAGAGFLTGTVTGNKQIELPAETILTFTLTRSITLK